MVSEYLKHTRTLEELDTFFEKARKTSVESAEIVFSQDVAAALGAVADIHEVVNARIMADTRVASAKLASSAEVYSYRPAGDSSDIAAGHSKARIIESG